MNKRVIITDDDGVIINSKDYSYNIFDPEKGYLFGNQKSSVKMFQDNKLSTITKNKADFANMHLLAECIYKDTNMIAVKRNKKYIPADIEDMVKVIELSYRRTKEFLQRMIELGIIAKIIINTNETIQIQYHVNPVYFNSNKRISPALYMMFRKQLDKVLPYWVVEKFNEGR